MPRSSDIRKYSGRYFEAISAAFRIGEYRLSFPTAREARAERLSFIAGVGPALARYMQKVEHDAIPPFDQVQHYVQAYYQWQSLTTAVEFHPESNTYDFILRHFDVTPIDLLHRKEMERLKLSKSLRETFAPYLASSLDTEISNLRASAEGLPPLPTTPSTLTPQQPLAPRSSEPPPSQALTEEEKILLRREARDPLDSALEKLGFFSNIKPPKAK